MINPEQLARLTLEVWRASGPRTEARRIHLLHSYAETYFGPAEKWEDHVHTFVSTAGLRCRQWTRIDELQY